MHAHLSPICPRRGGPTGPLARAKAAEFAGTLRGVSDGTRTRGRRDHNPELYQLSYAHQARVSLAAIRVASQRGAGADLRRRAGSAGDARGARRAGRASVRATFFVLGRAGGGASGPAGAGDRRGTRRRGARVRAPAASRIERATGRGATSTGRSRRSRGAGSSPTRWRIPWGHLADFTPELASASASCRSSGGRATRTTGVGTARQRCSRQLDAGARRDRARARRDRRRRAARDGARAPRSSSAPLVAEHASDRASRPGPLDAGTGRSRSRSGIRISILG